jgi:hypothetical protein
MNTLSLLALFIPLFTASISAKDKAVMPAVQTDTIDSQEGQFSVSVNSTEKKVEVVRETQKPGLPPQLRIRLLRKNDRPLELKLHLVDQSNQLPRYSGDASMWNGSVVGAQLEFSFDKKTWKRLGKMFRKIIP